MQYQVDIEPSATLSGRSNFRVLGFPFSVASGSRLAQTLVRRLYQGSQIAQADPAALSIEIQPHGLRGQLAWDVVVEARTVSRHATLGAALGHLEHEISTRIVETGTGYVPLHGALVSGPHHAALISGVSGAGKTTLALALAARGYRILGDDVAMLDPRDGSVWALPRCFYIDGRSWQLLREQKLDVPPAAARRGFLTPADLGGWTGAPVRVGAVFMMRGCVADEPRIARISQAEMIVLMEGQVRWQGRARERTLNALCRMLGRAACYSLVGGRLGPTADLVAEILGPPARDRGHRTEHVTVAAS